jgi:hypothetical protein
MKAKIGVIPDRRTLIVLTALVVGMSVISSLLMVLEPGPVAPISGITLQSIDHNQPVQPEEKLFDISSPLGWQAIVIHDSGTPEGSSQTINLIHQRMGKGGLGYHFVINNGSMQDDGLIEVGFRWQRQFVGAYLEGVGANWFNLHAIGICMVGDADDGGFTKAQYRELVWLVQQLQKRFNISREAVFVEVGSGQNGPSQLFPHGWFRQQLLTADQRGE